MATKFADEIFKCIFSNENIWILIDISLKFVPKGQIDDIPALVQPQPQASDAKFWLAPVAFVIPQYLSMMLLLV